MKNAEKPRRWLSVPVLDKAGSGQPSSPAEKLSEKSSLDQLWTAIDCQLDNLLRDVVAACRNGDGGFPISTAKGAATEAIFVQAFAFAAHVAGDPLGFAQEQDDNLLAVGGKK